MASLRILAKVAMALIFLISLLLWFYSRRILKGENLTSKVESLIEESKQSRELDLRSLGYSDWDELAIWFPYGNIRDLQIDGIWLIDKTDGEQLDDSINIILFLKSNRIVAYAKVSIITADFSSVRLEGTFGRIQRSRATFKIEGNNELRWIK
jgi:hypothetical protein